MKKFFALPVLLVLLLAGCAAPACRPVAFNPPPAAAAPPPAPAVAPVPVSPPAAPASNEPGYLHASGGAFY
jgi:hypothetical protein